MMVMFSPMEGSTGGPALPGEELSFYKNPTVLPRTMSRFLLGAGATGKLRAQFPLDRSLKVRSSRMAVLVTGTAPSDTGWQ